jgi:hypothetical protein
VPNLTVNDCVENSASHAVAASLLMFPEQTDVEKQRSLMSDKEQTQQQ